MKTNNREDDMERVAQALQDENLPADFRKGLELVQKALTGDEGAMNAAILYMADLDDTAPAGGTTLTMGQKLADPVELAHQALLKAIYGDVESIQELGRRSLKRFEQEMAGPNPSPMEQVLAQQAAVCWMQVCHYERLYAARLNVQPVDSLGFQKEEFYQKRVALAQRRLESAIKTLAQVRKLALPTVQINVAEKQVNVGNGQLKIGEAQVNVLADGVASIESELE